jgi:predicted 2-oxoglutarate/Fe(II)-dependent dioxygenase YbiX
MKNSEIKLSTLISHPYIRQHFLNTDECFKIIKSTNTLDLQPSLIFSGKQKSILDKQQRKSHSMIIRDSKLTKSIAKKSSSLIKKFWEINPSLEIEWGQLAQYKKGNFFNWHQDAPFLVRFDHASKVDRIFSLVIQLSESNSFTGGEIELEDILGNIHHIDNLEQGEGIIFPAVCPHRVKKINSKARYSLSFWFIGKPLTIK